MEHPIVVCSNRTISDDPLARKRFDMLREAVKILREMKEQRDMMFQTSDIFVFSEPHKVSE